MSSTGPTPFPPPPPTKENSFNLSNVALPPDGGNNAAPQQQHQQIQSLLSSSGGMDQEQAPQQQQGEVGQPKKKKVTKKVVVKKKKQSAASTGPSTQEQQQEQGEPGEQQQEAARYSPGRFKRATVDSIPVMGLPEGVAKKRLRELIALRRDQQRARAELMQSLFSSTPWMKEIRQTTAALYKKDDIVQQLQQLVAALQHAEGDESSRHAVLRDEFEQIYAEYQDQHDRLTAQLQETPLVTQEVNFQREQRPHKMTRHPVLDMSVSSRRRWGCGEEDLSSSRVVHDYRPQGKDLGASERSAASRHSKSEHRRCVYKEEMTKVVDRPKLVCSVPATQMLRTIYMPNEHADLLVLTLESLQMQLSDQEKMCDQKARLMAEMRNTRASEHKKRVVVNKDAIQMLRKSVRVTTNRAMERSRAILVLQQQLTKQTSEMERERQQQTKELVMCNNLRDHVLMKLERKQSSYKTHYDKYKQVMNAESRTRNSQFDELKLRYQELQRLYRSKIDALDAESTRESKKLRMLQEQRQFVIEQLASEVKKLREDVRCLQIEARGALSSAPPQLLEDWLGESGSSLWSSSWTSPRAGGGGGGGGKEDSRGRWRGESSVTEAETTRMRSHKSR